MRHNWIRIKNRILQRIANDNSILDHSIINEAVNLELNTIFIAIPKTGTTSIRAQLKQEGTPIIETPHLNIIQIRDLIYIYMLKITLGKNQFFPSRQVPLDSSIRKRAEDLFKSCFKFSAVRNPWARAVSLYFRREGIELSDRMSFDKFCSHHLYASDTCKHPTLHQNQYDWLCDENGRNLMDYIYKVENFEQAIDEVKSLTNGRLQLMNLSRNRNPHSKSNNYRAMYNSNTQKIIAKRFEKDIDMFKYTF